MKKRYSYQEKVLYGPSLVETYEDIKKNTEVLDSYLESGIGEEYDFAVTLVKRGACFLAIKKDDGYRFYPSRFIGYMNNDMNKHKANMYKDGKITNPAISKILKTDLAIDPAIEREYFDFCNNFGVLPDNKVHKFWI